MQLRDDRVSTICTVLVFAVFMASCAAGSTTDEPGTPPPPTEQPAPPPVAQPPVTDAGPPDHEGQTEAPPHPGAGSADSRMRGTWVHLFDDTLKSRASIVNVLDELVAADANAVFVQVARRHDAYYTSDVLPRTTDPTMPDDLDLLDVFTSEANIRGLPVHAWVPVAPTWHPRYAEFDPPPGWLATEHGQGAPEDQRWVTRDVDGVWSDYLDPALPEVRQHVEDVVTELVTRYALDGIHLDYVRYPSDRHGYHPAALDRYRSETGATGIPAPDDLRWSEWRREQTQALVSGVRDAIDATGSNAELSVAVVAWGQGPSGTPESAFAGTRPAREALQDWEAWVHDGIVDAVMPMVYFRAHVEEQARWFDQWIEFSASLAASSDVRVVPGVAGWLNTKDSTLSQVSAAMSAADGALVYSYQQPTADDDHRMWSELASSEWATTQ
jgi:uncharacterized lipoprotein YddW (UPF0748 family)